MSTAHRQTKWRDHHRTTWRGLLHSMSISLLYWMWKRRHRLRLRALRH